MNMDRRQKVAYALASEDVGMREIAGSRHNPDIVADFAKVGHSWVKDDETAWCAAFIGARLIDAGLPATMKLNARSYLDWGKPVDLAKAEPGDVVVFSRGDPNGWQGHVGFFVKDVGTHIEVLGGNQSNAVNVARYAKTRLLGVRRWPASAPQRPVQPQSAPSAPKAPGGFLSALMALFSGLFAKRQKPIPAQGGPAGFVPVPHQGRTIWVTPDYHKDNKGRRVRVSGAEALRIAQERSRALGLPLQLPTAAMVDSIWRAADVKLNPQPLNPDNTGNPRFWEGGPGGMTDPKWFPLHDAMIERQLAGRTGLIAGHMKDVLRDADPLKTRIHGWHRKDGTPIQPDSNRHHKDYTDYSHGLRLVYDPEG